MRSARAAGLVAAFACLAVIDAATPAAAQMAAAAAAMRGEPDRVLDYQVDWGPLKLAEVSFRVSDDDGAVVLDLQGESKGLAAMVADFKVEQKVVYGTDGMRRFESLGSFDARTSRRVVRWDSEAAAPVVTIDASADDGPRTPIPAAELTPTVDPAFPLIDALRRVGEGGDCSSRYRVFDGERRFNIIIEDEGDDVLEGDRDWTYAGPARRCRLRFQRVGGFLVESDAPVQAEENEYDRTVWLARLPDGMAPVRLRVSWPLGYATGRIDLR
ncbi:MAG: DUF3108 domain-containing protein [Pseudomonadota bacterium]